MKLQGTILQLNFSPKGEAEGIMLQTKSGPAQLNIHPPEIHLLEDTLQAGGGLDVEATLERKKSGKDHPIYRLVAVRSGTPLVSQPRPVKIKGVVARLNYTRHGDVNGAVLESGDFIHLKPHGAKAISLTIGQKLEIKGTGRPFGSTQKLAVEAETVNGLDLTTLPQAKKAAKKAPKKQ